MFLVLLLSIYAVEVLSGSPTPTEIFSDSPTDILTCSPTLVFSRVATEMFFVLHWAFPSLNICVLRTKKEIKLYMKDH